MKEILKRIALKLTSSKFIICLWAMIIVSYMVFTKTSQDNQALVMMLGGVPLAYCGFNVLQKNIENRSNGNE